MTSRYFIIEGMFSKINSEINFRDLDLIAKFYFSSNLGGGEEGGISPPPEAEKIVVEKWCYFRRLYF